MRYAHLHYKTCGCQSDITVGKDHNSVLAHTPMRTGSAPVIHVGEHISEVASNKMTVNRRIRSAIYLVPMLASLFVLKNLFEWDRLT